MNKEIDIKKFNKEFFLLSLDLEKHHGIFSQLTRIGKPVLDSTLEIPTAAISFDEDGECILFSFHPTFWQETDHYTKLFVICHECLHVMLSHGKRGKGLEYPLIGNIAMDIINNEMLINKFNFKQNKINEYKRYIWFNNVFPNNKSVKKNRSFEYYYNQILKICKNQKQGQLVDNHNKLNSFDKKNEQKITEKIGKNISTEEMKNFNNSIKESLDSTSDKNNSKTAGTLSGNLTITISNEHIKKKKKWETVIKKWSQKFVESSRRKEHWLSTNRRTTLIDNKFFLPSSQEYEEKDKSKIDVWFFQDTSGSCKAYAKRFFKAIESLDPKKFNIKLFCFDTKVYEVNMKHRQLYGFGGTSFNIIEKEIQKRIQKENIKYPEAIFVITDGYGNKIDPQYPKKWYWFLTKHGNTNYLPKKSNIFKLEDYE